MSKFELLCELFHNVTSIAELFWSGIILLLRVGLEPGSPEWEVGALTRRLKTAATIASVASAPLEIRGVRLNCTAPTHWPPLNLRSLTFDSRLWQV